MIKSTYKYENVKCIGVYDGDTITVLIDFGFKLTQELKIRLHRIDTPELRGSEKASGIISRDFVRKKILDKNIMLETIKKGKYGRIVAEVYFHDSNEQLECMNDLLVDEGLAIYKDY